MTNNKKNNHFLQPNWKWIPNPPLFWSPQRLSALEVRCMRPVGVCVTGRAALCLGRRQAVRGRGCVRRAAFALLGSTWATRESVWRPTCAPAYTMDRSTGLMTSTQITTAFGQSLRIFTNHAQGDEITDVVTLFVCFPLFVCVATVRMATCTVAPMRRVLYCLTSSMTTAWHHPEVQLHYFTVALLNFHVVHEPPVCSEQLISFTWQLKLRLDNVIAVWPMTTVETCRRSHQFGSVIFINKIDFWISQNHSIKLRVLFENF